jgi:hypothetical protein
MHLSTYCGSILVIVAISFAAPTKSSNGCGYAVSKFQDLVLAYIDYNVDCRHVIWAIQPN